MNITVQGKSLKTITIKFDCRSHVPPQDSFRLRVKQTYNGLRVQAYNL